MGHSLCKESQQGMHQVIPNQLLSYQLRHRYGKQSVLHALLIFDEQLQQRAHLHELPTTFRCNQQRQKKLRQLGRRLSGRFEFPYRRVVQTKEQRQVQQRQRVF